MVTKRAVLLAGIMGVSAGIGCNSSPEKATDSPTPTPTITVTPTPTPSATPTPPLHAAMPQIQFNGTAALASPVLVPIIYDNDGNSAAEVTFLNDLVASTWWTTVTKDYGVGAATVAAKVSAGPTAPSTVDDSAVQTSVDALASPGAGAIYVNFFPAGTSVTRSGATEACGKSLAYHAYSSGNRPYAVVPDCNSEAHLPTDMDEVGAAASHEIIESATDPDVYLGWDFADSPNAAWDFASLDGEVADFCEYTPAPYNVEADIPNAYTARIWSNSAAAANQDPCVPATGTYFNAAPEMPSDNFPISILGVSEDSWGVSIAVGASATITLDLYGSTTEPFTVTGADLASLAAGCSVTEVEAGSCAASELQFSFAGASSISGSPGDKLQMTIKVLKAGTLVTGGSPFYVVSQQGSGASTVTNLWVAYVADG